MKKYFIKSLLSIALLFLGCFVQKAQAQFSNNWINFSNTYYKFKVYKEGIYRINQAQLSAANMSTVAGSQFAVFREGQEVPIYVSTTGTLGANDYIEFYGYKADGKMDAVLYPNGTADQGSNANIISDTAYYFITYDNTTHQRMSLNNNAIPPVPPAPAAYCFATSYPNEGNRSTWHPGYSHASTDAYFSSDFERCEGYGYLSGGNNATGTLTFQTPQAYTGGPAAVASFVWAENNLSMSAHPKVNINGTPIYDTTTSSSRPYLLLNRSFSVNAGVVSASSTMNFNDPSSIVSGGGTIYSAFMILNASIKYPRGYDFSGNFSTQAAFQIPAADRYIEVSGFTTGGQVARLYDKTNGKIYQGTEVGGVVKFYLDISAVQRDVLLTNVASISSNLTLKNVPFRDYSQTSNQGNYIILAHKNMINASPSYVNEFKQYRASIAGGSFTPVVVDVTELYDQFAYGYDYHPLAVKNFAFYATSQWTPKPDYLFIIGKGVEYIKYPGALTNPNTIGYSFVPCYGDPGSDNLFSCFNFTNSPTLATGRLSAWTNDEVGNYLSKVQKYEIAIKPLTIPTVDHEFWKKKVLHIAGGSDIGDQVQFVGELATCEGIIRDTLVGGMVTTAKKSTTDPVSNILDESVDSLITNGVSDISYYGHGSSSGFSYNLNSPDEYNSTPKFPVFGAYACDVAYIYDTSLVRTISEKYINSVTGGSIAMIGSNNLGWTGTLPAYMENLYRSFSFRNYGKTLGLQYRNNLQYLKANYPNTFDNAHMDIHIQCQLLQGDPGLTVYDPPKVDYAIEEAGLTSIPVDVSTALDTFQLKVNLFDLGKSVRDSVLVRLQHTLAGSTTVLYADSIWIHDLLNSDTILFNVPLNATTDVGLNNYTVKIDANNKFDELSEDNNQATFSLFIYSESLIPLYPKDFGIVHEQGVTLKASTLNAFAPLRNYRLEIDTTTTFTSTIKQGTVISSIGGVLKWKPNIVYKDSVVYYWRAAPDSLVNGKLNWNGSSFIYLANGSDGWNQSHYFQYLEDVPFSGTSLPASTRKFSFSPFLNTFETRDKVVNPLLGNFSDVSQSLNDILLDSYGCGTTGSIEITVIDSTTGVPWRNTSSGPGLYGSIPQCNTNNPPRSHFEFSTWAPSSRNDARLFLQSIPVGSYIAIKNLIYDGPPGDTWDHHTADVWLSDTAIYGPGNSLYDVMNGLGFTQISQFTSKKSFVFFCQKGINTFVPKQQVSAGATDLVSIVVSFNSYPDTGMVNSTVVGPALQWQTLKWHTTARDNFPQNDSDYVQVIGIDTLGHTTALYKGFARDTSLAFINAKHYPNLRLIWNSVDNINRTSDHLDYWRVLYKPVPEAALNAAAHYVHATDTTSQGQTSRFEIAVENLTPYPMDSMLVAFKFIDNAGVKHALDTTKKYKPLLGNDTLIAALDYDLSSYLQKNYLVVEANPNNNQPEQYHPNNIGNKLQYVLGDNQNPVLDVTFDGIHILDKDIVSAKPFIKMLMHDDNKFLALNDTASMKVQLMYPNQSTPVDVPLDGTICKFIPAVIVNGTKNEARVEYKPTLVQDGLYQLIVSGKDRVGNVAGNSTLSYKIDFTVDNQPSITNVLNYPNPFSTATKFVFTMTGSEIPSQFKIQILSVTGKIVREIKKSELGNLHIGRNITDYAWDGKDEFGQMLGNGVYLYRVVTSIRGDNVDHRDDASIDKYFKNGYGKLYIMR
jgi:hypothetical protein